MLVSHCSHYAEETFRDDTNKSKHTFAHCISCRINTTFYYYSGVALISSALSAFPGYQAFFCPLFHLFTFPPEGDGQILLQFWTTRLALTRSGHFLG